VPTRQLQLRDGGAHRSPAIRSFSLIALPSGAPGTAQPSSVSPSSSKLVSPAVPGTSMSSMNTPFVWTVSSLA
jgi:hypothetical protein